LNTLSSLAAVVAQIILAVVVVLAAFVPAPDFL
jgi:hypothetical protein